MAGRPSKYNDGKIKAEVSIEAISMMYEKGFIDVEICRIFNISEKTLNNYKLQHPEFLQAIKKGKEIADEKVVKALFERATGYSNEEIHISNYQGNVTQTPVIKHYPPDPTSIMFWLKNRQPDKWREKMEHSFSDIDELLIKRRKSSSDG